MAENSQESTEGTRWDNGDGIEITKVDGGVVSGLGGVVKVVTMIIDISRGVLHVVVEDPKEVLVGVNDFELKPCSEMA